MSNVDPTFPPDGQIVVKAGLRTQFDIIKNELETNEAAITDKADVAHAVEHVTGGGDKIRDATAAQDGLATAAQISKLDGIEAGAEVNDAANVGAGDAEVLQGKTGSELRFRTLIGGDNITVTEQADTVTITGQAGGGATEAEQRTFTGTVTPDVANVTYAPFVQVGATAVAKGAGAFNGSTHFLPFTSDGSAIDFGAGFVDHGFNALSSLIFADGTKTTLSFIYHEQQDVIVVLSGMSGALAPEDLASGTITPRVGALDFSGGSTGDVWTVQADGALSPSPPTMELLGYSEIRSEPTISAGAVTVAYEEGNVAVVTLTESITDMTLDNPPASGKIGSLALWLVQDATGGRTVTWPASVDWGADGAPTIASGADEETIVTLLTRDGGTSWKGTLGWVKV